MGGINELILNVIWKGKGRRTEKHFEKGAGRLTLPGFQTYSKAAIIETHGERDTYINRTGESPETDPHPSASCFSTKV